MNGAILFLIAIGYGAALCAVAFVSERRRRSARQRRRAYTLGLAVYCTSWTFYGAVGTAATAGWAFLPIYLGPALVFLFAPAFLSRLVAAVQAEGATSIADFIGSRFDKSRGVAALVTVIALFGTIPYLALQLRSVGTTYAALARSADASGPMIVTATVLALFAMVFGTRRYEAAGRSTGVLFAVSVESIVKLTAFAAIGLFATMIVVDAAPAVRAAATATLAAGFAPARLDTNFLVFTALAAAAIVCLPRQFHLGVIEASSPRDPVAARWPFVGYLAVTTLLVVPITLAGILLAPAPILADVRPDLIVMQLPLLAGARWLALLVFLGGFSAATGMVLVETIALSTMVSNDLIAPLLLRRPHLVNAANLGRTMLRVRRGVIAALMLVALGFALLTPAARPLASIGLVAFAAMAQVAPALAMAVRGGGHDATAAKAGLSAGLVAWVALLLIPTLTGTPLLPLVGIGGLDMVSEGALASLALNLSVHALVAARGIRAPRLVFRDERVAPVHTRAELIALAGRFVGPDRAAEAIGSGDRVDRAAARRAERLIAGVVGAPSARALVSSALSGAALGVEDVTRMLDESGQSLQFSKGLLAATLEHIDPGVSVVDAELNLVAWNTRYLELFDFPAGLIRVGAPVADAIRFNALKGECGPGEVDDHVERRLTHMRRGTSHAFERVRPDGRVLKTVGGPMPGGGYVMCFTDTTAEAAALAAAERARDELETRVAARTGELVAANAALARATSDKTRFLAAASHDLLQPLHAARLFTAALARETDGALVDRIDQSIVAAEALLRTLLDISKLDAGGIVPRIEQVALRPLLADLLAGFAGQAAAKHLRLRLAGADATVATDPVLLRSILQNLVGNAVRYTRAGGVVVGIRRRGRHIRIDVVDSGPGIADHHRATIFREFERLDTGEDTGVGLGLAIVDRTARLLDAPIDLASRPGHGSRFSLTLVRSDSHAASPPPSPTDLLRPVPCTGLTLLIVDDDPRVRAAMAALATSRGHYSRLAADHLAAHRVAPGADAAFIDHDLGGGMDGLSLIADLRRAAPALPAALVTADASPALAERARTVGVEVLLKPLDPARFDDWLARAV